MIGYLVKLNLKHVRLPSNTHLFFMKIIFVHSYKTIGEYYNSNLLKKNKFKDVILGQRICFKIGIYLLYTLLINGV